MASPYPILIGQSGAIEGAPRYFRDSKNGSETTVREWLGYKDDLIALAWGLTIPYEIAQVSGPIYRLSITLSGRWVDGSLTTDPNDQIAFAWELHQARQRKDLWELPKVRFELEKITDVAARARCLRDIRDLCNGEVITYESNEAGAVTTKQLTLEAILAVVTVGYGVDADVMTQFAFELARGVDGYTFDSHELTKTRVGPANATNLVPQFASTNIPITSAALLALEPSMPASIASQLPTTGFWLRTSDVFRQLRTDQVEVNSQWVYATEYSTFIYG